MKKQIDLIYLDQGLFTVFFANTAAGEKAWRVIAAKTEGTGKIFTMQLSDTLKQLRAAGFSVKKQEKISEEKAKKGLATIFRELDQLQIN